jgi:competence protein ComEA
VLGVVVVTLLAVAVFGLRVARAQSEQDGRVIAPGGGSRAGPTGVTAGAAPVGVPADAGAGLEGGPRASAGSGAPGSGPIGVASGPRAAVVVVHVVGEVRTPGLQRLAAGSRVADALQAAGGPTGKADLARVNLARLLIDGEQVRVPAPGDPDPVLPPGAGALGSGAGAGGTGAPGGTPAGSTTVSLNTADLAALESLPGVGPVLAQRILDWRTQHGRFTSVEELGEVNGIGEKLLAQLTPLVSL